MSKPFVQLSIHHKNQIWWPDVEFKKKSNVNIYTTQIKFMCNLIFPSHHFYGILPKKKKIDSGSPISKRVSPKAISMKPHQSLATHMR